MGQHEHRAARLVAAVGLAVGALLGLLGVSRAEAATPRTAGATTTTTTTPAGTGTADGVEDSFWLATSSGSVYPFGVPSYGSPGSPLNKPVVTIVPTADQRGYWLVASDGGVFSYGDATFYGSTGSLHLNKPIVGMAATSDGKGYWLVASDGGVFSYGDALFAGSTGSLHLNQPIVGIGN